MKTVEELKNKYNEKDRTSPPYLKENQEYDKERGIVITYDQKGRAFVSFPVSGVPLKQFEEWNSICESEFNSSRWQKIFLDHRMHLHFLSLDMEPEVVPTEVKTEEKKKETTLLSGETMNDE